MAWYVLKRPISRPDTSYAKATLCIVIFLIINVLLVFGIYHLFLWLGAQYILPKCISDFVQNHNHAFIVVLSLLQLLFGSIVALKSAVIGAIKLYQRYAPEDVRRRCLFKPTCSEYAIIAVKKYGVIRGLHKSYIRLFKRCHGRIYMVDEP